MKRRFTIVAFLLLNTFLASRASGMPSGQSLLALSLRTDSVPALDKLSARYLDAVRAKSDKLNRKLTRHTTKVLRQLQRQEEKIHRKLYKFDSLASNNLLTHSIDSLSRLSEQMQGKAGKLEGFTDRLPGKAYVITGRTTYHHLEQVVV